LPCPPAAHPGPRDDAFAKVGASSTVSSGFLHCFAGPTIDLGGRAHLSESIEYFSTMDPAGVSLWRRESTAAVVGWSAVGPFVSLRIAGKLSMLPVKAS
jgi:hypothetical protein